MTSTLLKNVTAALIIFVSIFLVSCSKQDTPSEKAKTTIAVIPKGTTHEYWKAIHAGARKAADETGVEIIWKGPLKEDDRNSQIEVVEQFVIRGVDGIVLAPLDDTALRRPVSEAVRSGIPVVIIDSSLNSDEFASYVATDNFAGGKKGGEHLAKLINSSGKVIMLRYQEGSASTAQREAGFLAAMQQHPDIEVVSSNQYGGATTESAYQASENLLMSLRNDQGRLDIDGIFCPNESTTFGMLRALQDAGFAGKIAFVGFDSSEVMIKALQQGQLNGLVLQDPYNMGYLGVKTIVRHLEGEKVESVIDTGSTLVTAGNMDQPEIQKLLRPPVE